MGAICLMVWCHFALACQSFCKKVRHKHKVSLPSRQEEPVLLSYNPEHQQTVCPRRPEREKKREIMQKNENYICVSPVHSDCGSTAAAVQLVCDFFQNIFQVCASHGFTLPAFLSSPALCLWRCWWSWGSPRCSRWWSHTACSRRTGHCCCWPAGSPCSPASLTSEAGKVRETDWSQTRPKQFQKDAVFL